MSKCILWNKVCFQNGYGQYRETINGKRYKRLAHRKAWEKVNGPIPKGMCVLHKCDNPPCVNVAHLFLGTKGDNTRDKVMKGRQAQKESHGLSKLTEDEVAQIRALEGILTYRAIGKIFGVTGANISFIIRRKTWR